MASRFDPNFTQTVIDAIGPGATPRTRQVMTSLIRHVHDFAREVELTIDEWMMGVEFLNTVGQISDGKRNEGQRISDVLGLESYEYPYLTPFLVHAYLCYQPCRRNRPPTHI